jgi:hypothetical protein
MTKILSCAVVVGLLVASSSSVFARGGVNNGGANASTASPGGQFVSGGRTSTGPGASGFAPGQQTSTPSVPAPGNSNGAAVYAPGFLK